MTPIDIKACFVCDSKDSSRTDGLCQPAGESISCSQIVRSAA